MNIFRNKILVKFIAIICIFLTLINFGLPNKSYAEDDNEVWGGILITPITNLLTYISDGIISLLHKAIQKQDLAIIEISGAPSWWEQWGETALRVILIAVVVVVGIALIINTAGGAAMVLSTLAKAIIKVGARVAFVEVISINLFGTEAIGGTINFIVEKTGDWFSDNLYMPVFTLTPEEIFANKINLFDVNFFNPMDDMEIERPIVQEGKETVYDEAGSGGETWYRLDECLSSIATYGAYNGFNNTSNIYQYRNQYFDEETGTSRYDAAIAIFDIINNYLITNNRKEINFEEENAYGFAVNHEILEPQEHQKYTIFISPNVDKKWIYTIEFTFYEGDTTKERTLNIIYEGSYATIENIAVSSTAKQLRTAVASWYFILRNLALLVLMIVLIYVGIRIAIGSTAGEKAKYKERLTDWLVAVCLVFILHYIMVFSIEFVENITSLVDSIEKPVGDAMVVPLSEKQTEFVSEMGQDPETTQEALAYSALQQYGYVIDGTDEDGKPQKQLVWIADIMGKIKIKSQIVGEGTAKWVGYSLCYMILVLFTLFFSWTYLKRVVYMAFLTIIAPLVAMTYPIDKINDGRAQAFEMWLKEYIFNLLIQPLHLLLYTVLVSAAYELASTNPVYAVVAIGFMIPAEKLVRRFFGFTKAQTPGALGGAAGAALAFSGLQKIMRFGSKKGSRKDSDKNEKENDKINFSSSEGVNAKSAVASEVLGKDGKLAKTQTKAGGDGKGNAPTDQNSEGKEGSTTQIRLNKNALESGKDNVAEKTSEEYKNWLAKTGTRLKQSKLGKTTIRGARTIRAGVGAYARGLGKKMTRRVNKARPIRALARGVAGAYGATALGMAGLAIGAASGDPSKAFQYGTAGLAGGYSVGKGLAGKGMDALSVNSSEIKEAMEMTWAGDEYGKRKVEQRKEELVRDEGSISYLMQTMGVSRSEAKEILRTTGGECIDNNISDKADIAAIHKMVNDGTSIESAIAAQKFSGYLPRDLDKMGAEEREDRIRQWANEYEEEGYDDPTYLANEHMKLVEKFIKARSSLKKA